MQTRHTQSTPRPGSFEITPLDLAKTCLVALYKEKSVTYYREGNEGRGGEKKKSRAIPLTEPLWTLQEELLCMGFKGGRMKSGEFREQVQNFIGTLEKDNCPFSIRPFRM